jgi:hypothetical protein
MVTTIFSGVTIAPGGGPDPEVGQVPLGSMLKVTVEPFTQRANQDAVGLVGKLGLATSEDPEGVIGV